MGQREICQFAGCSLKPSDGLEPSTPSLPSRFREGLGITGMRLPSSYSQHLGRFRRLSHLFLEAPSPTPESPYLSPEPVPIADRRGPPCVVDSDNGWRAPQGYWPRRGRMQSSEDHRTARLARCRRELPGLLRDERGTRRCRERQRGGVSGGALAYRAALSGSGGSSSLEVASPLRPASGRSRRQLFRLVLALARRDRVVEACARLV